MTVVPFPTQPEPEHCLWCGGVLSPHEPWVPDESGEWHHEKCAEELRVADALPDRLWGADG